ELLGFIEREFLEEERRLDRPQRADFGQTEIRGFAECEIARAFRRDPNMARLSIEPRAAAGGTFGEIHVFLQLPPPHRIAGCPVILKQFWKKTVPRAAMAPNTASIAPFKRDVAISGAVQKKLSRFLGQIT